MAKSIIVIMAGGTGGHIFPGIACANKLIAAGHDVYWLGAHDSFEARIIPNYQIPMIMIKATGIRNKSLIRKFIACLSAMQSLVQIIKYFYKLKPKCVIGFGGYVTGAGGLAAKLLNIPLIIHEQNSVPGMTNKLLAKIANKILTGFPDVLFKSVNKKVCYAGNPVRSNIYKTTTWQPHNPLRILVIGGSQGAVAINKVIIEMLASCNFKLSIWHQTGNIGFNYCATKYAKYDHLDIKVEPFIDDIRAAYEWSDLVICRAGAITVAELAAAGRPSILVPYPHAVDNHQHKNAEYLVKKNAALLIEQDSLTADKLAIIIDELRCNTSKLQNMAIAAKQASMPNATATIIAHCATLISAKDTV